MERIITFNIDNPLTLDEGDEMALSAGGENNNINTNNRLTLDEGDEVAFSAGLSLG